MENKQQKQRIKALGNPWEAALSSSMKFVQLDIHSFDPETIPEGQKLLIDVKKAAERLFDIFYGIQAGGCSTEEGMERLTHICAALSELGNSSCASVKIFATGLEVCASWMQPYLCKEEFCGAEEIEGMLIEITESIRETEKLFKALVC